MLAQRTNKGKGLGTHYSTSYIGHSWPAALYNLESGSSLARANDTAMHYMAIHCHNN